MSVEDRNRKQSSRDIACSFHVSGKRKDERMKVLTRFCRIAKNF